jgi:hypothetical protein
MKRQAIPALAVLALVACATVRSRPDEASVHYEAGLQALARHDFSSAIDHLDDATRADDPTIVERALYLRLVAELDPRNPERRLDVAAERASQMRDSLQPGTVEWMTADALSHLASSLREMQDEQAITVTQRDVAAAQVESLTARLDSLGMQRDSVRRRMGQLEQAHAELEKELKEKTAELERIKRVIRG